MAREVNFAEFENRVLRGDITTEEARRIGATHAAYGWACTPYGSWDGGLCQAYREGFQRYRKDNPP